MEKQLFEIYLEDCVSLCHAAMVKPYYGTMDEIIHLLAQISENMGSGMRYRELIVAEEDYDLDNHIAQTPAGKIHLYLVPVCEVRRFEIKLDGYCGSYVNRDGTVFQCEASGVDICRVLLETDVGYSLCIKAKLRSLRVYHHAVGWIQLVGMNKGFPGTISWDGTRCTMNLFAHARHYSFDNIEAATADMVDMGRDDMSVIMEDILGKERF